MHRKRSTSMLSFSSDSYLASVSDLMAGLLFLFIIALMVFALNLQQEAQKLKDAEAQKQKEIQKKRKEVQKKRKEVKRLRSIKQSRDQLLSILVQRLRAKGIIVSVDLNTGVLRLPEQILFWPGQATFSRKGRQRVKTLGQILMELLPCYSTRNAKRSFQVEKQCDVNPMAIHLDSIFIEGHTDIRPVSRRNRFRNNWELSAARAIETFKVMTQAFPSLRTYLNPKKEMIFGVSGYAALRPIDRGESLASLRKNRRIDLRFIMSPVLKEIGIVRKIKQEYQQRSQSSGEAVSEASKTHRKTETKDDDEDEDEDEEDSHEQE